MFQRELVQSPATSENLGKERLETGVAFLAYAVGNHAVLAL